MLMHQLYYLITYHGCCVDMLITARIDVFLCMLLSICYAVVIFAMITITVLSSAVAVPDLIVTAVPHNSFSSQHVKY